MNREIKFRAWFEGIKEMGFVTSLKCSNTDFDWNDLIAECNINGRQQFYHTYNFKLMQFTGFQDKKGVEIYEGDIFRVEEDGAEDGTDMIYYLVIVWIKEWGMFGTVRVEDEYPKYLIEGVRALDEPLFWTYTLEDTNDRRFYLSGNIYQNPELLSPTEIKSSYQHPKL